MEPLNSTQWFRNRQHDRGMDRVIHNIPINKEWGEKFFKMSAAVMIGTLRIKICTGPHILGGIKSYIHSPNAVCHKNFFAGEKSILNFHL